MEAKHIRMYEVGECLDMVDILLVGSDVVWDFEAIIRAKFVLLALTYVDVEIIIKEGHDQSAVFIISHTPTIVAL